MRVLLLLFLSLSLQAQSKFTLSDNNVEKGVVLHRTLKTFEFNRAVLRADAIPFVDSLALFLIKHPTFNLEILAVDDIAGTAYSISLASKRATQIHNYLINKGVSEDRLVYKQAPYKKFSNVNRKKRYYIKGSWIDFSIRLKVY